MEWEQEQAPWRARPVQVPEWSRRNRTEDDPGHREQEQVQELEQVQEFRAAETASSSFFLLTEKHEDGWGGWVEVGKFF